jgi:diguanylate cyclase (GGDEF)-like protein
MPHTQLPIVLDKIISLTKVRDSSALELSLAQTLLTLANVKNTTIHSASNINRTKHALANNQTMLEGKTVPADISVALSTCLDTAKVSIIPLQKNKRLTLFPLMCSKQKPLAVIAVEETSKTSNHGLTIQILDIYHNFLSLMNDNERDTLTGLLNRKTFDFKINDIISGLHSHAPNDSENDQEPTYLAIFDIDHFKRVNDTYGHLIGDEVLLLFSQQMSKNFREKDLLFRFGGEEFVGVFKCTDDVTMAHILNRFRKAIEDFNFPQVGKVTVSCGYTNINAFDLSSKVIDRADTALYHAKNSGRNQVCQHEQLIASGQLTEKESSGGEIELF